MRRRKHHPAVKGLAHRGDLAVERRALGAGLLILRGQPLQTIHDTRHLKCGNAAERVGARGLGSGDNRRPRGRARDAAPLQLGGQLIDRPALGGLAPDERADLVLGRLGDTFDLVGQRVEHVLHERVFQVPLNRDAEQRGVGKGRFEDEPIQALHQRSQASAVV